MQPPASGCFSKETTRCKDGKEHHCWSLVDSQRVGGDRKAVQRLALYLGEINSSQPADWRLAVVRILRRDEPINEQTFTGRLRKARLRRARRR